MTKALDPRQGLHRQLNLLEAYQVYQKDYPLFLPDIDFINLAVDSGTRTRGFWFCSVKIRLFV